MALANSLSLLVVVPTVTLCGRMVDTTGRYSEVFTAMLALSAVAALGLAFLVKEPRRGRLYMIKFLRQP